MYTGVIEDVGRVVAIEDLSDRRRLTITSSITRALTPDMCVAVNGTRLSIARAGSTSFDVEVTEDRLQATMLDDLEVGHTVNLERAISPGRALQWILRADPNSHEAN